jgi:hypothetical protein
MRSKVVKGRYVLVIAPREGVQGNLKAAAFVSTFKADFHVKVGSYSG